MKTLTSWLIVLVILISIILDCSKSEDDYYPLAVGNTWVYADSIVTYGDTTLGTTYLEITGALTESGRTIWVQERRRIRENDEYIDTLYLEERGDTLLLTVYQDTDTFTYIMMIQPMEPGQQWNGTEVIGYEDVTVPAGTFNDCVVINFSDEYRYYAPNVGQVKYRFDGYYLIVSVLETYNVE